jgi:signal transduction histidine kinase/CheY-like chemotaxis protein
MLQDDAKDLEAARLAAFDSFAFMTETEDETLIEICKLACGLFAVAYAQVTLVGKDRCYYLTRTVAQRSFARQGSFTDRCFGNSDVTIVPDALADERYADLPAQSLHGARFYGAAPLWIAPNLSLGVLSIYDSKAHLEFSDAERAHFRRLSTLVVNELKRQRGLRDLKKREEALTRARDAANAASQAKTAFLATMSHEIRTPLNGVLGMVQVMAADSLPCQQRERLEIIRQSGETLLILVNDILDLSKIEAGKLELEKADFNLEALLRGVFCGFSALAAQKGLSYDIEIAPEAAALFRGDSTRVGQILSNLISNALKFTAAGSITVKARREKDAVLLSVADTGIGIAPDALPRIFDKFVQADSSTTRRYGGTGLGLSICHQLARAMGGSITVTSEQGAGTTFQVRLPLTFVGAPRDVVRQVPGGPAPIPEAPRALKLLAAEDNYVNQRVLAAFLGQIGVKPVIVPDGRKALEAWEGGTWDLILMDIQMPELDGRQATAMIRKREAETGRPRTPIIALSADVMSHQLAEYDGFDIDGVLAKPINSTLLFDLVRQYAAAIAA